MQISWGLTQINASIARICVLPVSGFRVEGSRMIQIMLLKSLLQVSWFVSVIITRCALRRAIYSPCCFMISTVADAVQKFNGLMCLLNVGLSFSPSGNSRIPVYEHFDSTSHLIPGPSLVLYSDGGRRDPSTCSRHPRQHHWSSWQPAQIHPCQVRAHWPTQNSRNLQCTSKNMTKLPCFELCHDSKHFTVVV